MTNNSRIKVLKKAALPLLLSPCLGVSSALAKKTPSEQTQYQSCMSTKHNWLFGHFDPSRLDFTEQRKKAIEEFELQIKFIDLNRMDQATSDALFSKGSRLGLPASVIESIICIERLRRNHPEDEDRGFNCSQSCAVTVR
jgi:hypothetical protein